MAYNGALWSLTPEVLYYAVAPSLTRARLERLWVACAVLSAISFVCPVSDDHGFAWLVFTKLKVIKYFWCWVAGYYAYRAAPRHAQRCSRWRRWRR